jgi:nucleotide-binding universal stress UspA family protein
MKILAAVDGSPYTKRMLAYLAAHDEWLGPQHEYTLLHAVPAVPPRAAGLLEKETLKAYYDDLAEKVFKPIRTFVTRQGLKASFVTRIGPAGEIIAEAATKGRYDLLILGSHGHGTLTNLVMGSVATKVLASCTTPVLLIR